MCSLKLGLEEATSRSSVDDDEPGIGVRIGSNEQHGSYDLAGELILRGTHASAVFVLVLAGELGSDYSLHINAGNAYDAELWTRRVVSQLQRIARGIDGTMDSTFAAQQEIEDDDAAEGKH
jgi:hypothetical protein